MKKIYLMGLTSLFALAVNAQTTLRVSKPLPARKTAAINELNTNAASKTAAPMTIAANMTVVTSYTAGATQDIDLILALTNQDAEFGDGLTITFPAGITVNSTTNTPVLGPDDGQTGSGGPEAFNGISGQTLSWGDDDNNYGGIVPAGYTGSPGTYPIRINITVPPGTTGNIVCSYHVDGDQYATTSADFDGTFNILNSAAPVVNIQAKAVGVLTSLATVADLHNCGLTTHTVGLQVNNVGNQAESNIPVNFRINGVTFTQVVIPGPIPAGDSTVVLFPTTYNFSADNIYNIKAWSAQPGDASLANDTTTLTISNSNPVALTSTTYTNGVETAYDQGSPNIDWLGLGLPFGLSANVHSGTRAWFYTVNMTTIGAPAGTYASYINLPCMDVTLGDTYRITYWKKSVNSGTFVTNGMTGVFTGTSQDAAAMTTTLQAWTPLTPTTTAAPWSKDSVDYVATATETRYFAIGGQGTLATANQQINVRIDDIMITKVVGSVGIKTNALTEMSLYPNPTSGILNINATEATSAVEVFNVIGDKVYSGNLIKGNNAIDLSGLANGTYIVKMNSNNQTLTKKVVISK